MLQNFVAGFVSTIKTRPFSMPQGQFAQKFMMQIITIREASRCGNEIFIRLFFLFNIDAISCQSWTDTTDMASGIRLALRLPVRLVRWSAPFNCTISTQLSVVNSFYCRLQRLLKVRTVGLQPFDNGSNAPGHTVQIVLTYTTALTNGRYILNEPCKYKNSQCGFEATYIQNAFIEQH